MILRAATVIFLMSSAVIAEESHDCVIEPAVVVNLASQVGGLLEVVNVERGDIVEAGEEIARLRSDVERSSVRLFEQRASNDGEVMAQRSRLKLAEARADRLRMLHKKDIASRERLEEVEATAEIALRELAIAEIRRIEAKIELERAKEVLERRVIRSPIDGVVISRDLFAGEYADQDAPIVAIAKLDPLFVETFLPVDRFGTIRVGSTAVVQLSEPFEIEVEGRVAVVDRVFDAASGSFGVRVELPNTELALPAGQRCRVLFEAPVEN